MLNLVRWKVQILLTLFGLFASSSAMAQQPYYGRFVGNLVLSPEEGGSRMRLLQPYTFIDSSGGTWYAPAGTVTDGASIPQAAKSLIGGSWDGPYRHAAVIHDVACFQKTRPWELVHLTFYHAMLASKVSPRMAKIMYAAVYHLGPRWEPRGSASHLPGQKSDRLGENNEIVRSNRQGECAGNEFEQCWRVDLGPFGEARDCKCLPKISGGVVGERMTEDRVHQSANNGTVSDEEIVANLASYIHAKENSGGISIEEIQNLGHSQPLTQCQTQWGTCSLPPANGMKGEPCFCANALGIHPGIAY